MKKWIKKLSQEWSEAKHHPELKNIETLTSEENSELRDLLTRSGTVSTRNRRRAREAKLLNKANMTATQAWFQLFEGR